MTSIESIAPEGQCSPIPVPVLGTSVAESEARFINYFLEEDAELAVRKLDGRELLGNVVRVQRQVGACCPTPDPSTSVALTQLTSL